MKVKAKKYEKFEYDIFKEEILEVIEIKYFNKNKMCKFKNHKNWFNLDGFEIIT